MPSEIPEPKSPGRAASRRCWQFAGIVVAYVVCLIIAPFLDGIAPGRIVGGFLMAVYFNPTIHYAVASIFLGLVVWGLLGVIRAWNDPLARVRRFFSFIPLAFVLLFSGALFSFHTGHTEAIPGDARHALDGQMADQALRTPAHAVLYSIDPSERIPFEQSGNAAPDNGETFYEYKILGRVSLDGDKAGEAARAFRIAMDWPYRGQSMCFNPRHALRMTSEGHVYDFILCYECGGILIYRDGKDIYEGAASGSPTVLNALLTDAKVPLAR